MRKSSSGRSRADSEVSSRSERYRTHDDDETPTKMRSRLESTTSSASQKRRSSRRDDDAREGNYTPTSSRRSGASQQDSYLSSNTAPDYRVSTEERSGDTRRGVTDDTYRDSRRGSRRDSTKSTSRSEKSRSIGGQDGDERYESSRRERDGEKSRRRDSARQSSASIATDRGSSGALNDHDAALPQNQFPGQGPDTYTQPYRPPGLAASYYEGHAEPPASQTTSIPTGPIRVDPPNQAHLYTPSAANGPPPEPSSMGQVGAAASYYAMAAEEANGGLPSPSSRPSRLSSQYDKPISGPQNNVALSGAGVPVGAIGAAAAGAGIGAAAGYFAANNAQTSSYQQNYQQTVTQSSTLQNSAQYNSYPEGGNAPVAAPGPQDPNRTHYGAMAAAGVAGAAAAGYYAHNHHSAQHEQQAYAPGLSPDFVLGQNQSAFPGMQQQKYKHKHRGPLTRFADWFRDPSGVAEFEEYSEAIGICKYCFDPNSSPAQAPRKHRYHKHPPPGLRLRSSSSRIDKYYRSSSDDEKRRRSSKTSRIVAGGLAGYGAAKVGEALYKQKNNFDDDYSIKSGQPLPQGFVQPGVQANYRNQGFETGTVGRASSSQYTINDVSRTEQRESVSSRRAGRDGQEYVYATPEKTRDSVYPPTGSSGNVAAGIVAGAAAAAGVAAVTASERRRSRSRSRERENGVRRKRSYYSKRISPRHSYVDLSTKNSGPLGFGAFFSSPSANEKRGKKNKGLFNLRNDSSSSSDADLAFGEGTIRRQSSKRSSRRRDSRSGKDETAAILGLAATGAALAAESDRRQSRRKLTRDRADERTGSRMSQSSGTRINMHDHERANYADDDGVWEDAPDDDSDRGSVDTALAYGGRLSVRNSRESLAEQGTSKWAWRWNKGKEKKDTERKAGSPQPSYTQPPVQYPYNYAPAPPPTSFAPSEAVLAAGAGAAIAAVAASQGPSSAFASPLPPMQYVDPIPASSQQAYDRRILPGRESVVSPQTVVTSTSVPLKQPQVMGAPSVAEMPQVINRLEADAELTTSPERVAQVTETRRERGDSSQERVRPRKRDSSPPPLNPSTSSRQSVTWDLTDEQIENEQRAAAKEERRRIRREERARRRSAEVEAASESSPRVSQSDSKRDEQDKCVARDAEIERELQALYAEQREREDAKRRESENRRSSRSEGSEIAAAAVIAAGVGTAAVAMAEEKKKSSESDSDKRSWRRSSLKRAGVDKIETIQPSPSPPEETQQERIAKMAAQRINANASPVHENYVDFFMPEELAGKVREHNAASKRRADTEIISISPSDFEASPWQTFEADLYEPYDPRSKHTPNYHPRGVPMLELIEATPPGSRSSSRRREPSPLRYQAPPAKEEPTPTGPERSESTGSKVNWGDNSTHVYEVQTPEYERKDPILDQSDSHKSEPDRSAPRGDESAEKPSPNKYAAAGIVAAAAAAATAASSSGIARGNGADDGGIENADDFESATSRRSKKERRKKRSSRDEEDFSRSSASSIKSEAQTVPPVEGMAPAQREHVSMGKDFKDLPPSEPGPAQEQRVDESDSRSAPSAAPAVPAFDVDATDFLGGPGGYKSPFAESVSDLGVKHVFKPQDSSKESRDPEPSYRKDRDEEDLTPAESHRDYRSVDLPPVDTPVSDEVVTERPRSTRSERRRMERAMSSSENTTPFANTPEPESQHETFAPQVPETPRHSMPGDFGVFDFLVDDEGNKVSAETNRELEAAAASALSRRSGESPEVKQKTSVVENRSAEPSLDDELPKSTKFPRSSTFDDAYLERNESVSKPEYTSDPEGRGRRRSSSSSSKKSRSDKKAESKSEVSSREAAVAAGTATSMAAVAALAAAAAKNRKSKVDAEQGSNDASRDVFSAPAVEPDFYAASKESKRKSQRASEIFDDFDGKSVASMPATKDEDRRSKRRSKRESDNLDSEDSRSVISMPATQDEDRRSKRKSKRDSDVFNDDNDDAKSMMSTTTADEDRRSKRRSKRDSEVMDDDDTQSITSTSTEKRRSRREDKEKDKKSPGLFASLFSSNKSDVSSSSKKSSRSSKSESRADRDRDEGDDRERRRKRRSKSGDDYDDSVTAVSEPVTSGRRRSETENDENIRPSKRDASRSAEDDGVVSADEGNNGYKVERNGSKQESFLADRLEMSSPMVTDIPVGTDAVSGQKTETLPSRSSTIEDISSVPTEAVTSIDRELPPLPVQDEGEEAALSSVEDAAPPQAVTPAANRARRLSAIFAGDPASSPVPFPSPTAVPLHFGRRYPVTPGSASRAPVSPVASSPLTTPRTRMQRPKSTDGKEFKPLYLVERHNATRVSIPEPDEDLPSLPASRISSAHASVEDLRGQALAQLEGGDEDPFEPSSPELSRDRGRQPSTTDNDYLDSRSATPVPGERQRKRDSDMDIRAKREQQLKDEGYFHSPSELLQDPQLSQDLETDDVEVPRPGSPLPSVVDTENEQEFMSAESRPASPDRGVSWTREQSGGHRERSSSRTRSRLASVIFAGLGAAGAAMAAGLIVHDHLEENQERGSGHDGEGRPGSQPRDLPLPSPDDALDRREDTMVPPVMSSVDATVKSAAEPVEETPVPAADDGPRSSVKQVEDAEAEEMFPLSRSASKKDKRKQNKGASSNKAATPSEDIGSLRNVPDSNEGELATETVPAPEQATAEKQETNEERRAAASLLAHKGTVNSHDDRTTHSTSTRSRSTSFVPDFALGNEPDNQLGAFEEAFERAARARGFPPGMTREDALEAFLPKRDNAPFVPKGGLTPVPEGTSASVVSPPTETKSIPDVDTEILDESRSKKKGKKGKRTSNQSLSQSQEMTVEPPEEQLKTSGSFSVKNPFGNDFELGVDKIVQPENDVSSMPALEARATSPTPFGDDFDVRSKDAIPAEFPVEAVTEEQPQELREVAEPRSYVDQEIEWAPISKKDKKKKKRVSQTASFASLDDTKDDANVPAVRQVVEDEQVQRPSEPGVSEDYPDLYEGSSSSKSKEAQLVDGTTSEPLSRKKSRRKSATATSASIPEPEPEQQLESHRITDERKKESSGDIRIGSPPRDEPAAAEDDWAQPSGKKGEKGEKDKKRQSTFNWTEDIVAPAAVVTGAAAVGAAVVSMIGDLEKTSAHDYSEAPMSAAVETRDVKHDLLDNPKDHKEAVAPEAQSSAETLRALHSNETSQLAKTQHIAEAEEEWAPLSRKASKKQKGKKKQQAIAAALVQDEVDSHSKATEPESNADVSSEPRSVAAEPVVVEPAVETSQRESAVTTIEDSQRTLEASRDIQPSTTAESDSKPRDITEDQEQSEDTPIAGWKPPSGPPVRPSPFAREIPLEVAMKMSMGKTMMALASSAATKKKKIAAAPKPVSKWESWTPYKNDDSVAVAEPVVEEEKLRETEPPLQGPSVFLMPQAAEQTSGEPQAEQAINDTELVDELRSRESDGHTPAPAEDAGEDVWDVPVTSKKSKKDKEQRKSSVPIQAVESFVDDVPATNEAGQSGEVQLTPQQHHARMETERSPREAVTDQAVLLEGDESPLGRDHSIADVGSKDPDHDQSGGTQAVEDAADKAPVLGEVENRQPDSAKYEKPVEAAEDDLWGMPAKGKKKKRKTKIQSSVDRDESVPEPKPEAQAETIIAPVKDEPQLSAANDCVSEQTTRSMSPVDDQAVTFEPDSITEDKSVHTEADPADEWSITRKPSKKDKKKKKKSIVIWDDENTSSSTPAEIVEPQISEPVSERDSQAERGSVTRLDESNSKDTAVPSDGVSAGVAVAAAGAVGASVIAARALMGHSESPDSDAIKDARQDRDEGLPRAIEHEKRENVQDDLAASSSKAIVPAAESQLPSEEAIQPSQPIETNDDEWALPVKASKKDKKKKRRSESTQSVVEDTPASEAPVEDVDTPPAVTQSSDDVIQDSTVVDDAVPKSDGSKALGEAQSLPEIQDSREPEQADMDDEWSLSRRSSKGGKKKKGGSARSSAAVLIDEPGAEPIVEAESSTSDVMIPDEKTAEAITEATVAEDALSSKDMELTTRELEDAPAPAEARPDDEWDVPKKSSKKDKRKRSKSQAPTIAVSEEPAAPARDVAGTEPPVDNHDLLRGASADDHHAAPAHQTWLTAVHSNSSLFPPQSESSLNMDRQVDVEEIAHVNRTDMAGDDKIEVGTETTSQSIEDASTTPEPIPVLDDFELRDQPVQVTNGDDISKTAVLMVGAAAAASASHNEAEKAPVHSEATADGRSRDLEIADSSAHASGESTPFEDAESTTSPYHDATAKYSIADDLASAPAASEDDTWADAETSEAADKRDIDDTVSGMFEETPPETEEDFSWVKGNKKGKKGRKGKNSKAASQSDSSTLSRTVSTEDKEASKPMEAEPLTSVAEAETPSEKAVEEESATVTLAYDASTSGPATPAETTYQEAEAFSWTSALKKGKKDKRKRKSVTWSDADTSTPATPSNEGSVDPFAEVEMKSEGEEAVKQEEFDPTASEADRHANVEGSLDPIVAPVISDEPEEVALEDDFVVKPHEPSALTADKIEGVDAQIPRSDLAESAREATVDLRSDLPTPASEKDEYFWAPTTTKKGKKGSKRRSLVVAGEEALEAAPAEPERVPGFVPITKETQAGAELEPDDIWESTSTSKKGKKDKKKKRSSSAIDSDDEPANKKLETRDDVSDSTLRLDDKDDRAVAHADPDQTQVDVASGEDFVAPPDTNPTEPTVQHDEILRPDESREIDEPSTAEPTIMTEEPAAQDEYMGEADPAPTQTSTEEPPSIEATADEWALPSSRSKKDKKKKRRSTIFDTLMEDAPVAALAAGAVGAAATAAHHDTLPFDEHYGEQEPVRAGTRGEDNSQAPTERSSSISGLPLEAQSEPMTWQSNVVEDDQADDSRSSREVASHDPKLAQHQTRVTEQVVDRIASPTHAEGTSYDNFGRDVQRSVNIPTEEPVTETGDLWSMGSGKKSKKGKKNKRRSTQDEAFSISDPVSDMQVEESHVREEEPAQPLSRAHTTELIDPKEIDEKPQTVPVELAEPIESQERETASPEQAVPQEDMPVQEEDEWALSSKKSKKGKKNKRRSTQDESSSTYHTVADAQIERPVIPEEESAPPLSQAYSREVVDSMKIDEEPQTVPAELAEPTESQKRETALPEQVAPKENKVVEEEDEWALPTKKSKKDKKKRKSTQLEVAAIAELEPEPAMLAEQPSVHQDEPTQLPMRIETEEADKSAGDEERIEPAVAVLTEPAETRDRNTTQSEQAMPEKVEDVPEANDEWALPSKKSKKGKKNRRSEPSSFDEQAEPSMTQTPEPVGSEVRDAVPTQEALPVADKDVTQEDDEWALSGKKSKKDKKKKRRTLDVVEVAAEGRMEDGLGTAARGAIEGGDSVVDVVPHAEVTAEGMRDGPSRDIAMTDAPPLESLRDEGAAEYNRRGNPELDDDARMVDQEQHSRDDNMRLSLLHDTTSPDDIESRTLAEEEPLIVSGRSKKGKKKRESRSSNVDDTLVEPRGESNETLEQRSATRDLTSPSNSVADHHQAPSHQDWLAETHEAAASFPGQPRKITSPMPVPTASARDLHDAPEHQRWLDQVHTSKSNFPPRPAPPQTASDEPVAVSAAAEDGLKPIKKEKKGKKGRRSLVDERHEEAEKSVDTTALVRDSESRPLVEPGATIRPEVDEDTHIQDTTRDPALSSDNDSNVSESTRERRKRRRSPRLRLGDDPEDLPRPRAMTPPPEHDDMMDTALGVAAIMGFGGAQNETAREAKDAVHRDEPGWSFAKLDNNTRGLPDVGVRNSGVQFDSPGVASSRFSATRDSGFIPSPPTGTSWDRPVTEAEPTRSTRRSDRVRSPTSSDEDVRTRHLSTQHENEQQALDASRHVHGTPSKRQPSPVSPTSKDRSSVLFQSSPAGSTPSRTPHAGTALQPEHRRSESGTDLHRTQSIHGHQHRSREDLGRRSSSPSARQYFTEQHSESVSRSAHPEHGQIAFNAPPRHGVDRRISPPKGSLHPILEHSFPETQRGVVPAAIMGGVGAAAMAAGTLARDHPAAGRSLGTSEARTSSSRDLRDTTTSPFTESGAQRSGTVADDAPRDNGMAEYFDGYGAMPGSPMSPTRPPSVRKRQSMQQIRDLEAKVDQLANENRSLVEAKIVAERHLQEFNIEHSRGGSDTEKALQAVNLQLQERDQEIVKLRAEIASLIAEHDALKSEHDQRYSALSEAHSQTRSQWQQSTRDLESLHAQHTELSAGMEDIVRHEVESALVIKNSEISRLQAELANARVSIRELQSQILKMSAEDIVVYRDEDYFDNACQQLCQHVQQWVLRFSKFSDSRICRRTDEVRDEKLVDQFDNAVLDGSEVDVYLADRIKRRDVFMSVVMALVWKHVFARYLFGLDRDQRQKLRQLEENLTEVGPPNAVQQWRAITLTLLTRREAFKQLRDQETEAVVLETMRILSKFLPPPQNLEQQILDSLRKVMQTAVNLSIEMRTQKADYIMLPPLQPEYDTNGDLARQIFFNASLMNERSGETSSNEELEADRAVVRLVLFPLVVKKGDGSAGEEETIVVCPAQVLVARPDRKRPKSRQSMDARSLKAASTHSLAMSGVEMGEDETGAANMI